MKTKENLAIFKDLSKFLNKNGLRTYVSDGSLTIVKFYYVRFSIIEGWIVDKRNLTKIVWLGDPEYREKFLQTTDKTNYSYPYIKR